jgi:hypothetical protein
LKKQCGQYSAAFVRNTAIELNTTEELADVMPLKVTTKGASLNGKKQV